MKRAFSVLCITFCVSTSSYAEYLNGWGNAKFGMTLLETNNALKGKVKDISDSEMEIRKIRQIKSPEPAMLLGEIAGYKWGSMQGRMSFSYGIRTKKLREISFTAVGSENRGNVDDDSKFKASCLQISDKFTAKYGTPNRPSERNYHRLNSYNEYDDSYSYQYVMNGGSIKVNYYHSLGVGICAVLYNQTYDMSEEGFDPAGNKIESRIPADKKPQSNTGVIVLDCTISPNRNDDIKEHQTFNIDYTALTVNGMSAKFTETDIYSGSWKISRYGPLDLLDSDGRSLGHGSCTVQLKKF